MNRAYISDKKLNVMKEVKVASDTNKCGRCKGTVYHAEEIKGLGKVWHANCFVCANSTCKKRLDSMNVAEHEGEAYCKTCYANAFGPKGYGFAGGAAGSMTLTNTSIAPTGPSTYLVAPGENRERRSPSPLPSGNIRQGSRSPLARGATPRGGEKDTCGRCQKKVYAAEKVWGPSKDQPWHQNCLNCKDCGKRLDSSTMKAYENEVYCTACYNKYYTPLAKR